MKNRAARSSRRTNELGFVSVAGARVDRQGAPRFLRKAATSITSRPRRSMRRRLARALLVQSVSERPELHRLPPELRVAAWLANGAFRCRLHACGRSLLPAMAPTGAVIGLPALRAPSVRCAASSQDRVLVCSVLCRQALDAYAARGATAQSVPFATRAGSVLGQAVAW